MSLAIPHTSVERLVVPVTITGVTAQSTVVSTALSSTATHPMAGAPTTGWQDASWLDDRNVLTHLIDVAAGTYGLWLRVAYGDETAVLYVDRVVLT